MKVVTHTGSIYSVTLDEKFNYCMSKVGISQKMIIRGVYTEDEDMDETQVGSLTQDRCKNLKLGYTIKFEGPTGLIGTGIFLKKVVSILD
jgi:hypothetical protein